MMGTRSNFSEWSNIQKSESQRCFSKEALKSPLLYQQRGFSEFWTIIQSDCFWATNARFSNDDEEREFGLRLAKDTLELGNLEEASSLKNHFIVCFCSECDKLSQWRGYAPYGGVSIGFDFSAQIPFTVFPKPKETGKGYADQKEDNVVCYQRPLNVHYYDASVDRITLESDLALEDVNTSENLEVNKYVLKEQKRRFLSMIPYIKHSGFREEDEWRIVINSDDFPEDKLADFQECISYRPIGYKQIPFICLKPGNAFSEENTVAVRIRISLNKKNDWRKEVSKKLKDSCRTGIKYFVFDCMKKIPSTISRKKTNDKVCFGCHRRQGLTYLGPEKEVKCAYSAPGSTLREEEQNSIIISQGKNQKEIFDSVYQWATEINKKETTPHNDEIKVWCEGHLPIRKIMVGPSADQKEMVESIRNYCLHSKQYWLRCVDVLTSSIPYRTPIVNNK